MLQYFLGQIDEPRLAEDAVPAPAANARGALALDVGALWHAEPRGHVPVDKMELPHSPTWIGGPQQRTNEDLIATQTKCVISKPALSLLQPTASLYQTD